MTTTTQVETDAAGGRAGRKPARGLGLWMATALVAGNMIGSGVFLLPASLAPFGGISIVGWLVTAAGALMLALVFANLSRVFPRIGGPYAYSRMAFGDFIGFQMAWGYWIAIWAGNAAIAVAFVGYLGVFLPAVTASPFASMATGVAAIWVLTGINSLGVRAAGWVQLVTTVAKILPLLAVGLVGIFWLEPAHFLPFNATGGSAFSAVNAVAALTLWAFLGLESASIPADDVEAPERTIPRSTILGTLIATVVYVLGTVAVMGIVPPETLQASTAPFADAARAIWGSGAGQLIAIGALFSTFGALNGWILLQGQIPLAAAKDRLFPARFGGVSANGTPVFGLVVSSILVTVLMATSYSEGLVGVFNFTLLLATMTTLVPYMFTAMGELMLFFQNREAFSGKRFAGSGVVAVLAFLYSIWAVAGSGEDVVFWGSLLLFAGIPVYVWLKWQDQAVQSQDRR
ncbi:amino acid permease [Kaustia mangrovi]|uniref:Arginine/agmatine antiporter n=1 Tax=Kaustia mangrovi TaxID=2593653 RepID=A0A7S8C336_9HYPH|nr:amino acid permease [Kaustia mangrovi]QPC42489.1 amino acid permease [Kaustia mangrovi]